MPPPQKATIAEHLYWSYANLAMAEVATHYQEAKFSRNHFMIRAKLYSGLVKGTMAPRSFMRDQRIRMKLPKECVYCGETSHLALDHIVPINRGGADSGENVLWACRKCNSSKSDSDVFEWWFKHRAGFPPLLVIRIYLKQAIAYCNANNLMGRFVEEMDGHPFSFKHIPTDYPEPETLVFAPFYARKAKAAATGSPTAADELKQLPTKS